MEGRRCPRFGEDPRSQQTGFQSGLLDIDHVLGVVRLKVQRQFAALREIDDLTRIVFGEADHGDDSP